MKCVVALLLCGLVSSRALADCPNATVDFCFRPGAMSCDNRIVDTIHDAKKSLFVQAYDFTNPQIIQAIGDAKKRGLEVRIILDKTNRQPRYTGLTYLRNAAVPVRIDDRVAIAHNKVIILDGVLVIGGSYNYTKSAETRNAENVTFTSSSCVAKAFKDNFDSRWAAAKEQ